MKKFLLIVCALLWANDALSQNYYANTREIIGDGFTYVCEDKGYAVEIYNANNIFTDVHQTWHNGVLRTLDDISRISPYDERENMESTIYSIFSRLLSPEEKRAIEPNTYIYVDVYFDPSSGQAIEVKYDVRKGFLAIPPEKYFAIEQQIKQQISVVPTDEGRTYNYLFKGNKITGEELNRP